MSFKNTLQKLGIDQSINYLYRDPESNLRRLIGWLKQEQMRKKYGCNIPWTIFLDHTSACNLHCTGCWTAEYTGRPEPVGIADRERKENHAEKERARA